MTQLISYGSSKPPHKLWWRIFYVLVKESKIISYNQTNKKINTIGAPRGRTITRSSPCDHSTLYDISYSTYEIYIKYNTIYKIQSYITIYTI